MRVRVRVRVRVRASASSYPDANPNHRPAERAERLPLVAKLLEHARHRVERRRVLADDVAPVRLPLALVLCLLLRLLLAHGLQLELVVLRGRVERAVGLVQVLELPLQRAQPGAPLRHPPVVRVGQLRLQPGLGAGLGVGVWGKVES